MKQLTEDQFDELELIPNHIDDNASWSGNMFETYGEEVQHVLLMAQQNRVVTIIEGDGEGVLNDSGDEMSTMYYVSGMHLVNRIGYLITKEPINEDFEVKLDDW